MSLEADALIDRRALRRKLSFWRVLTLVVVGLAILAVGLVLGGRRLLPGVTPHVARLTIDGVITVDKPTLDAIARVKNMKSATAAVVSINSPGGTTTGSEALYRALRELAAEKPTVALVTGTAASGAYIAAMATDRIIAPETGIVGSIGVVLQYPNVVKTLDMLGVKVESVRSSPLKAQPSGIEPTPPEAREALVATVMDTYDWFRALVKERRALNDEELKKVADGRVFTGRQGLPLKLVDELGGEKEARAWLAREHKIATGLRIIDYRRNTSLDRFGLFSMAGGAAAALGFPDVARALLLSQQASEAQALDGLVSVWQPPAQN